MSNRKLLRGRHSQPAAWYQVTTVTAARTPLLVDPLHADAVIAAMRECDARALTASAAWVVMPDHVHWLFELTSLSLSTAMQTMKSLSARAINASRGQSGRVWQIGYYDHRVRHDEDLRVQARYLVENPVRAGLINAVDAYPHLWCRWDDDTP